MSVGLIVPNGKYSWSNQFKFLILSDELLRSPKKTIASVRVADEDRQVTNSAESSWQDFPQTPRNKLRLFSRKELDDSGAGQIFNKDSPLNCFSHGFRTSRIFARHEVLIRAGCFVSVCIMHCECYSAIQDQIFP